MAKQKPIRKPAMTQTTGELLDTLRHRKKPDGEYMFPSLWKCCDYYNCKFQDHLLVRVFDYDIDAVGPVLEDLAQAGIDFVVSVVDEKNYAAYCTVGEGYSEVEELGDTLAEAVFAVAEAITRPEEE